MTIGGSDSGGGAGIQADLRTFSFHRVHGTSVITCITAQNTMGVSRVDALAPDAVLAQIEALSSDMHIAAAKTGMLLNSDIIEAVANYLRSFPLPNLVVDPVMVSRAGDKLLDDGALEAMRTQIVPLAEILTPNLYEAELLSEQTIESLDDMKSAAMRIKALGPKVVVVKGGALDGEFRAADVWCDGDSVDVLSTKSVDTPHTHGTGCTLSAAIAASLASGLEVSGRPTACCRSW